MARVGPSQASEANVPGDESGERMHVRYAEEFHASERLCDSDNELLRRVNRFIVYYFGVYLCNLNLETTRRWQVATNRAPSERVTQIEVELAAANRQEGFFGDVATTRTLATNYSERHMGTLVSQRLGDAEQSKWKRRLKVNRIPQVLLAGFCACQVYLIVAAYYQYSYDFDVLRMRELQRRRTDGASVPAAYARAEQLAELVKLRMAATKLKLDWLGSDHSHTTILAACFYTTIVLLSSIIHLPIYLHHQYQRPFGLCHVVRYLLDQEGENEISMRLVDGQLAEFLESSRVYHANMIDSGPVAPLVVWDPVPKMAIYSFVGVRKRAAPSQCAGGALARRNGREVLEMVREMLATGALVPLYKLRSWIRRQTPMQFAHHFFLGTYSIVFHIALNWGFYSVANQERQPGGHPSTRALLKIACLGPLIISTLTLTVHPPISMLIVREQIHYIFELRRMIAQCIELNSIIAAHIDRRNNRRPLTARALASTRVASNQTSTTHNNLEHKMDSNLVFVLLHYKIFVAQLRPMLLTLGVLFVTALAVLFTLPLIVRLHIPYLRQLYEDKLTDTQIRIFLLVISATNVVPINMLAIPICHMFAQCECLYRDLSSLMAHISEVKSLPRCNHLYDNHSQSNLLKELSDSSRLLGKLKPRAGPISATYTNLVKALFWYGLLLISIMADNSSGTGAENKELLKSMFSDPLGVYNEI